MFNVLFNLIISSNTENPLVDIILMGIGDIINRQRELSIHWFQENN